MTLRQRIALSLPVPPDVESTLNYARWAEHEQYDDVWFADSGSIDSLTLAAVVADRTEHVRIGTGVMPVFTRTPAVLAATAATISHLAPGRFILGLGASSHAMVEGWHGQVFEKPLTRVRETTELLRQMLSGERTDYTGQTVRSQGYRQNLSPREPVPIYLAALRAKMLETAGELGDGVVINLFPFEALPRMMERVAEGARRAGKDPGQVEVVCRHQVIVTADRAAARETVRKAFVGYYGTPVYNKFLAWCGYEEAAAAIEQGFREKDRDKTAAALGDELIDRLAIIGSADECREQVRELGRGGVHTHIIACPMPDPYVLRATIETFSPRNFKLD